MSESLLMSWDCCPSEILYLILKEVDIRTFFNSRCVCKRWKHIADDIGQVLFWSLYDIFDGFYNHYVKCLIIVFNQNHKIWEKFCRDDYSEFYLDIHRKSQLSWINVYKNILLWQNIKNSVQNIDYSISYNHLQIINVHVFKDKLIVVCDTCIKYFLIYKLALIKTVGRVCIDCQENEYMNLELKPNRTLCLYGKSTPNSFFVNPLPSNENHKVVCYSLQDQQCYFIDESKRALWICEWRNDVWKEIFLARYYGVTAILDMSIWKDEVYILTQGGDIYKTTLIEKKFYKLCSTVFGPSTNIAFLFKKCNVLVSVHNMELTTVHKLVEHSNMQIPGLSCFMEHAGMLILGNMNCEIQIYNKDDLTKPLHKIYIEDTPNSESRSNPIIAIDVCEYEHGHFVIASTNSTVYVISCRHPYSKVSEEMCKRFCIK